MSTSITRSTTRRSPLARALVVALLAVLLLVAMLEAALVAVGHGIDSSIPRVEGVFDGLEDRPVEPRDASGVEVFDILLLGTDSRSSTPTTGTAATTPGWLPGAQRTDTMMLVHVSADRSHATVVSLPRDSWVDVPGHGQHKLNAAFSLAGPSLAVATVEQLTGIRVDHLAIVDHQGLASLVDVMGGVDVSVPATVRDPANDVTWTRGEHHLDGPDALLYVRHRYGLPGGDLDRIERQHEVVRSLTGSLQDAARSLDVIRLHRLLDTLAAHVTVDAEWRAGDMVRLALDLRHLDGRGVRFLTAPVLGTGWEGDQSVVRLDHVAGRELWADLRADRVPAG